MRYRYHRKTMRPDVLEQIQRVAVARYLERVVGSTFGYSNAIQDLLEYVRVPVEARWSPPAQRDDFDDDEVTAERTMIGPALGPARAPGRSQL